MYVLIIVGMITFTFAIFHIQGISEQRFNVPRLVARTEIMQFENIAETKPPVANSEPPKDSLKPIEAQKPVVHPTVAKIIPKKLSVKVVSIKTVNNKPHPFPKIEWQEDSLSIEQIVQKN